MRATLITGMMAVLAAAACGATVLHIDGNISSWRGGSNVATHGWIDNWPNANADGTIAKLDRKSAV